MTDHISSCAAANLLCAEETHDLWYDDFDCLATDEKTHQLNNQSISPKIDRSDPLFNLQLHCVDSMCLMFEREKDHLPRYDYLTRLRSGELDLSVRTEAIDWIWKAQAYYNFGPLSIYLSINYLDRFLSIHEVSKVEPWAAQLLAVACLLVAIKMEEIQVPNILDLQVGDPNFSFEVKTIKRMEIMILRSLKWRMSAYTPFSFIDYFLTKMNNDQGPSLYLMQKSNQLILNTVRGIDLLEFKASEISAAVAMSVLGEIKAVDIDGAISCFVHLEKGRIVKCVEMIQDLGLMSSGSIVTSLPQSPNGVLEAATSLSYKRYYERTIGPCRPSSSPSLIKRRKLAATITSSPFQTISTSSNQEI